MTDVVWAGLEPPADQPLVRTGAFVSIRTVCPSNHKYLQIFGPLANLQEETQTSAFLCVLD